MAERIIQRTEADGQPATANGVGIVGIISSTAERDNDHIVLGEAPTRQGSKALLLHLDTFVRY
jgi:hypothetical protein